MEDIKEVGTLNLKNLQLKKIQDAGKILTINAINKIKVIC